MQISVCALSCATLVHRECRHRRVRLFHVLSACNVCSPQVHKRYTHTHVESEPHACYVYIVLHILIYSMCMFHISYGPVPSLMQHRAPHVVVHRYGVRAASVCGTLPATRKELAAHHRHFTPLTIFACANVATSYVVICMTNVMRFRS